MTISIEGKPEARPAADPRAGRPRRLRALILDDDAADRMRLARLLRLSGIEVDLTEVEDVAGFLPALDRDGFDVVFIDYWLGFENGLDALAILSAHDRQGGAAAIMLTGATDPHVIVEAMRSGCADYLVKSELCVDTVRACIAAAFERRIMHAAMREAQDLRAAIRRLVDRLSRGRIPGLADPSEPFEGTPRSIDSAVAKRLSAGLLADLELLWQLRRD